MMKDKAVHLGKFPGGYSGFQVTGTIEGFLGALKFSVSAFCLVGKFWQVFFLGSLI